MNIQYLLGQLLRGGHFSCKAGQQALTSNISVDFMESIWFIELGVSFSAAISNEVQIEGISYQLVIRWLGRQAAGINGARLVKPW